MQVPAVLAAILGATVLTITSCSPTTEEPSTSTSVAPPASSSSSAVAQPDSPEAEPTGPSVLTPVTGYVLAAPIPVPGTDGKDHLAYELQLSNMLSQDVTLTSVAVMAGEETLLSLAGDDLAFWTRVHGNPTPTTTIGAAQSASVWLDVALDRPTDGQPSTIPTNLTHAVGISVKEASLPLIPESMTETIAPTDVQAREPAVISSPLRGSNWLDGDGCCAMSAHRMALNPINGQLWGAERFAIDWVQLDEQNRLFTGPQDQTASYAYFGADIHAVADGPVVAVVDDLPEQVPGTNPSGLQLDQYGGNHIVQDIGNGNYAFYAHLQPGSLQVSPGDQLSTGQVIASLGNSGNSDAPHLHFHVMSTPDPLRSNGLPFVIDNFTLDGRLPSEDALNPVIDGEPAELTPGFAVRDVAGVMPLDLDVTTFGEG